jgi:hypothetical protein
MATTQTPKFTREFGSLVQGGTGHTAVLASPGQADLLVQRDDVLGGYSVFRRGDRDVVSNHRLQGDAKAYALAAYAIDQA